MTRWTTEIGRDIRALDDLSTWWDSQPAVHDIPFLNSAVLKCWMKGFLSADQQPQFRVLYKDGEPAAAVPTFQAGGRMRSMSTDQVDPFDLIVSTDPETIDFLPVWLERWPITHFYKVRESSVLVSQGQVQPRWVTTKTRTSPYVDLSHGIDAARSAVDRDHSREIQRRRRRLAEMGQFRFVEHPNNDSLAQVLERGLKLEASGWKGAKGVAVLRNPSLERWYRCLAEVAHERGWLRLSSLYLDDAMIAFAYGLVYGGRRYGMVTAYDESPGLTRLSAGSLLLEQMLEWGASQGLTTYEFGYGATGWKQHWTKDLRTIYDVSVYGSGLAGRAAFGLRSLRVRSTRDTTNGS